MATTALLLVLASALLETVAYCQSLHGEELIAARDASSLSVRQYCTGFQYNAEVKNLDGWLVPDECVGHIRRYINRGQYQGEVLAVINEARAFAKHVSLKGDRLDAWVLDIDETSLSNVPYYATHRYGALKYNSTEFNQWVEQASEKALVPTLTLFGELVKAKWSVIFITGRPEKQRHVTEKNLLSAGYKGWAKLILKSPEQQALGTTAQAYKSIVRKGLVKQGYRIWGNVGDQWSDISGEAAGNRTFKLPNPLYFIP